LNTATEADLQKLPGVGPKKAKAILALREKLGGKFKRLEDLMRVRGLKRRALERIRPLVVLDAETEPPKKPDTR
jgi:competence protein ComEA